MIINPLKIVSTEVKKTVQKFIKVRTFHFKLRA